MTAIGVIPSRLGATRFPRKPLALIAGKPMVVRVWERAQLAKSLSKVIVATDSDEIAQVIHNCGGEVIMTDPNLPSGTDRCGAAVRDLSAEYVINIQGDEPAMDPQAIDDVVSALQNDPSVAVATPALELFDASLLHVMTSVKVVTNSFDDALYFSRAPIPFPRFPDSEGHAPLKLHIGLYGYRRDALEWFCTQSPSSLERREGLEQLRFLEHGWKIRMTRANAISFGVDMPEDVERIEKLLVELGIS